MAKQSKETAKPNKKKHLKFGRYALLKKLRAEGDYIQCFQAHQIGLEREVEIRILAIKGGPESPLAVRFVEELKVLARLDHPSILAVMDQGVAENKRYFTTPLHNTKRLSTYLTERGGSLPSEDFLKFAETLTDAVAMIHNEGKLHRGISSSSVYVNMDKGEPYIGECSAMKEIREESLTSLGLPTLGEYVPTPEGIMGKTIDERTDVYLLCSLFYEMLAGEPPVTRNRDELITQLRKCQPNFVPIKPLTIAAKGGRDIKGIDELVMRGLEADPSKRYSCAVELAEELRKVATRHEVQLFVREKAAQTMKLRAPKEPVQKKKKRRKSTAQGTQKVATKSGGKSAALFGDLSDTHVIAGGGVIALVLLVIVGASFFGAEPPPTKPTRPTRPTSSSASTEEADAKLLALFKATRAKPTDASNFKKRVNVFRNWVVSKSGANKKVCRYTDLMKLRYRYLAMGDTKTFAQLDKWIAAAADRINEGGPPSPGK
mgnify:CR=1 FL=1